MRRPIKNKREPEADMKYGSVLVSRIINRIMKSGDKSSARKIVYGALEKAEAKIGKPALDVLNQVVENAAPNIELRSRRVGGANYQVPIEVRPERRLALALKWIIDSARAQKGKGMQEKFSEELINAYNNAGNAVKKKSDVHRMAEANKAFAHFGRRR